MKRSKRTDAVDRRSNSFAMAALFSMIVFAVVMVLSDGYRAAQTRQLLESRPVRTVRVQEGDTIWGVAQECAVEGVSTSDLVMWLCEHNDLSNASLTPGQPLSVPACMTIPSIQN